jgi:hypothetical protein
MIRIKVYFLFNSELTSFSLCLTNLDCYYLSDDFKNVYNRFTARKILPVQN